MYNGNERYRRLAPEGRLPFDVIHGAQEIGLSSLTRGNLTVAHQWLQGQLYQSGIHGERDSRRNYDGLKAVRTKFPKVSVEAWEDVPDGTTAVVGELGRETGQLRVAVKEADGGISLSQRGISIRRALRPISFDQYIQQLADSILDLNNDNSTVNVGFSLEVPHTSILTDTGMDAIINTDGNHNRFPWNSELGGVPDEERNIMQAVQRHLRTHGVEVEHGVIADGATAVALDIFSASDAAAEGFVVLDGGMAAGADTTAAIKNHTLDIGNASWSDDQVARKLRQKLQEEGKLDTEADQPLLKHELGEYLPLRLAMGIELLGDKIAQNSRNIAEKIWQQAETNNSLISDIAAGKVQFTHNANINLTIRLLARSVLRRAEQVYGAITAVVAEPPLKEREDKVKLEQGVPVALLTTGDLLHAATGGKLLRTLNTGVRIEAANLLGREVDVYRAVPKFGLAAAAMAWDHLEVAA